jgi:hypothetical protein
LSLAYWYPDEYDILQMIARGDDPGFVSQYKQLHPEAFNRIRGYELVDVTTGFFEISDLADFLRIQGDEFRRQVKSVLSTDIDAELLPQVPDPERIRALAERRAGVENGIRRLIVQLLTLQHQGDVTKVTGAIIKALPQREDRPVPSDLFVGRSVGQALDELYLQDLGLIVRKHWKLFGWVFDENQQRFMMNLESANFARNLEAHSKAIPGHVYEDGMNSLSWLEARVRRVEEQFGRG